MGTTGNDVAVRTDELDHLGREVETARLMTPVRHVASECREPTVPIPDMRARYAGGLGRAPSHTIPWPPARNDLCWSDPGRKHKKCCAIRGSGGAR